MSWWDKATIEQKLAQIDGGLEVGMTVGQVATNLGSTRQAVQRFCELNGRCFPRRNAATRAKRNPAVFDIAQATTRDEFTTMLDDVE